MPTPSPSRGGLSGRSIGLGALKALHINRLCLNRYMLIDGGDYANPDDIALGTYFDATFGLPYSSASFAIGTFAAAAINYQIAPAWPSSQQVKFRTPTGMASLKGLAPFGAGFSVQPNLVVGEVVEITFGSKMFFRVCDPASTRATHKPMAQKIRLKNGAGWAVGDTIHIGYGKTALPAGFESYTDFVGFKLQKGASDEADILALWRQASAVQETYDTGRELVKNLSTGQGMSDLEIRMSGAKGNVKAEWFINGSLVKTKRLTTIAAGIYNPSLFISANSTFSALQVQRYESGPVECMERE